MAIDRTWSISVVGGRRRQLVSCTGSRAPATPEEIVAAIDAHVTAEHP